MCDVQHEAAKVINLQKPPIINISSPEMRLPRRRASAVGEAVPDVNDNTAVLLLAAPLGRRSAIVIAITKPLELMHLWKRARTAVRRDVGRAGGVLRDCDLTQNDVRL